MNTLHIVHPDWSEMPKDFGIDRPYGFWSVADEPMLHHWFDMAQECDYDQVIFHAHNAVALRDLYFDKEHLWPVKCQFSEEKPPSSGDTVDCSIVSVESLCVTSTSLENPDMWDLISHHWNLVTDRLEILWSRYKDLSPGLPVGRGSKVDRTAELIEPYWIGENCEIKAGATVGPFACVGDNCIISEGATVSASHVGANTTVGVDIELHSHFVEEGKLFNRKDRVRHRSLDPLILSSSGRGSPHTDIALTG